MSFALAALALGQAPEPPRYAAQQTINVAPLSVSFWPRFKRLWLLAGLRQYPRRLSRLQTSALKLPALRHQKISLNQKGRRANSVVKPIFGVSANFALQIAASPRPTPPVPTAGPPSLSQIQRFIRLLKGQRTMFGAAGQWDYTSSCNIGQEKATWPAGAPTTTQLKMTYSAFGEQRRGFVRSYGLLPAA